MRNENVERLLMTAGKIEEKIYRGRKRVKYRCTLLSSNLALKEDNTDVARHTHTQPWKLEGHDRQIQIPRRRLRENRSD